MKTILNKLFKKKCKHNDIRSIVFIDWKFDVYTDNDDIDDTATNVEIKYCHDCGKIISWRFVHSFEETIEFSTKDELMEYEKVTGNYPTVMYFCETGPNFIQ